MKGKNVYFGLYYLSLFPLEPEIHLQQRKFHHFIPSVLLKEKWNSRILKSFGGICYIYDLKNITTSAGPERCLSQ